MRTYRTPLLIAVCAATTMLVLVLLLTRKGPMPTAEPAPDQAVGGTIVQVGECNIPDDALTPSATVWNADGMTILLPRNYKNGMPLVQMAFRKRGMDGIVEPYCLDSVTVYGDMGMYGAHTLIHGVTDAPKAYRGLRPGAEYTVTHYVPAGGQSSLSTAPLNPTFRVPEDLPPSSVYKVELIIEDAIARQEHEDAKQAEAQRRQRIAEQEAITITFSEPPNALLSAIYHAGDHKRESHTDEAGVDRLVIKGPNPLDGELAVYRTGNGVSCLAYIRHLQRRSLTLPKDADIFVVEDRLIDLTVKFRPADRDRLAACKGISLYDSTDSTFALFFSRLHGVSAPDAAPPEQVVVKAMPGTYHLRIRTQADEEIEIGEVSVSATGPNVFTMELPDEQTSG